MRGILVAAAAAITFGAAFVIAFVAFGGDGDDNTSALPTPSVSPSPTATPSRTNEPSETPGRTVEEIAYVEADGDIWLAPADGGESRLFAETNEDCVNAFELVWSPDGEYLACLGYRGDAPVPHLAVYGSDGSLIFTEEGPADHFSWSPDSGRFAYTVTTNGQTDLYVRPVASPKDDEISVGLAENPIWSRNGGLAAYRPVEAALEPGATVGGVDIFRGAEAFSIRGDYYPLAWVSDVEILVATNRQPPNEFGRYEFEVNILDPATRQTTRVPALDGHDGFFWLSPDGSKAAFVPFDGGLPTLAVVDFETLAVAPIPDSHIGFPSEYIPADHLAFAADGQTVFWADVTQQADIYAVALDGSPPVKLGTLEDAFFLQFSPDRTRVVYGAGGDSPGIWTADINGSDAHVIRAADNAAFVFAWRPLGAAGDVAGVCAAGSTAEFAAAQEEAFFDVYCPGWLPDGFVASEIEFENDKWPASVTPPPQAGSMVARFQNDATGARITLAEGNLGNDLFPQWRQNAPPSPSPISYGDEFSAMLYASYEDPDIGLRPVVVWVQGPGVVQRLMMGSGVDEATMREVAEGMTRVRGASAD